MICFSTCWNSSRHTDGYEMIKEIVSLGINKIELSHGMMMSLVPGVLKAFNQGLFEPIGLHNYWPSPVEVMIDDPDCYQFTSHRKNEREKALSHTIKTIDYAQKFGAKYIVLHMGTVPIGKFTRKLGHLARDGKIESSAFTKLRDKMITKRKKKSKIYFQRAKEALEQLYEHAEKAKVKLAVESRSSYEDMPIEEEMLEIFDEYKDKKWLGYWHDFGHVQRRENLGLINHEKWLEYIAPNLVGCHVHDVKWPLRDHQVPLNGEIEFKKLLRHIPKGVPMVWELSKRRKKEEIINNLQIWRNDYSIINA